MKPEIIEKVLASLNKNISDFKDDFVAFSSKNYDRVNIERKNFSIISRKDTNSKIAFIDGGNAEILKAPNFSMQFVRICSCIYKNNKRLSVNRKEFYVLVNSYAEGSSIKYRAEFFPLKGNIRLSNVVFDSDDPTLSLANFKVNISSIGSVIRRFCELIEAEEAIHLLDSGDFIVLDGTLQATFTEEEKFLERLYNAAKERGIAITALAKTTDLFTNSGNSASVVVSSISPEGMWYYYPVAFSKYKLHKADIYFVKLHEKSDYVFRFEAANSIEYDIKNILSMLAMQCSDPIFLGYPYGLVDADRTARVSSMDAEYIKTMTLTKAGKKAKEIRSYLNSVNAHSVLDSIG